MSEQAPELIVWNNRTSDPASDAFSTGVGVPYRRADIAWLPEELVERIRAEIGWVPGDIMDALLRDILAALRDNANMGTVGTQNGEERNEKQTSTPHNLHRRQQLAKVTGIDA